MNGVVWWNGRLIPLRELAEALEIEYKEKKEEEKQPPPKKTIMKISDIKTYGKNAKVHNKSQIKKIADSIKRFGFNVPIVLDKNHELIAGHGRLEASKLLGFEDVKLGCARAKVGERYIPAIIVEDLTEKEIKAYRLADNKLNESPWDMDLVTEELKLIGTELLDLTGFDKDLILEPGAKDDDIPELPKKAKSKLGDVYQIGNHRVMCGDATKQEDVEKLMEGGGAQMCFTDPPYNVDYQGGMGTHEQNKRSGILNDKMSAGAFNDFLYQAMRPIIKNTKGGIYVCMSSSELASLKEAFERAGGHWQSFIMWVKNNFTLSRSDYQNTYEPILYGWADKTKNHFFIDRRDIANVWEDLTKIKTEFDGKETTISFQGFKVKIKGKAEGQVIRKKQHTDIWRHDKPVSSAEHPTMKPVALCLEAITNSSKRGQIVLDTFLGSGSTLIASEKSERICYGMELDPKYIDVIIQRYVDYTGDTKIIKNGKKEIWQPTK
jgi:DNA modification methylase